MANIEFNTNQQRRVPIKRNSMFYDREQYLFDLELGREYVEGDMGQSIVLYQVDLTKTNQDQLYGEASAGDIIYFPPVEVPCVYEVKPAELRGYEKTKNLSTYQKPGQLQFGVYQSTLDELGVDIKIGDYVGIQITETQMIYYQVDNDGKNNYDNAHTQFGTIPLYRSCTASYCDPSIFNG